MELASEWCTATIVIDAPAGTTDVTLRGELDVAGSHVLREALQLADASDCPRVVLHVGALEFLDLAGLRLILDQQDRSRARGGELELREPGRLVRILLQAAGVQARFDTTSQTGSVS